LIVKRETSVFSKDVEVKTLVFLCAFVMHKHSMELRSNFGGVKNRVLKNFREK
jgi:hypothetical protein